MIYMTCPTCGKLLGQLILDFEKNKTDICNNPALYNQRHELVSELITNMKSLRYCCKMRIMTYKDVSQDIIPLQK